MFYAAPTSSLAGDTFKSTLVRLSQHYLSCKPQYSIIITNGYRKSFKELISNSNVIVSRPDRGSGWVLMDKSDYMRMFHGILRVTIKSMLDPLQKNNTT